MSILLLNTDRAYYHYKPQLVPLQASVEAMIWLLLAFKLIKASKLQAHKLQYDLYSNWKANYVDTASPNHKDDDNLYMTLPEGTDASAIFARLNKAINGFNRLSYEDLQWRQSNGSRMSPMWFYKGFVNSYHFRISVYILSYDNCEQVQMWLLQQIRTWCRTRYWTTATWLPNWSQSQSKMTTEHIHWYLTATDITAERLYMEIEWEDYREPNQIKPLLEMITEWHSEGSRNNGQTAYRTESWITLPEAY